MPLTTTFERTTSSATANWTGVSPTGVSVPSSVSRSTLTRKAVAVKLISSEPGRLVVELPVTDSPRLLEIDEPL